MRKTQPRKKGLNLKKAFSWEEVNGSFYVRLPQFDLTGVKLANLERIAERPPERKRTSVYSSLIRAIETDGERRFAYHDSKVVALDREVMTQLEKIGARLLPQFYLHRVT